MDSLVALGFNGHSFCSNFLPTLQFSMGKIDYTHAYFVLPISLGIVWGKRQVLKNLSADARPQPTDVIGLAC